MSCMAGVVRTPTLKKELEKLNDWESVLTKSELKTERNKLFAENTARHALAEIQPLPQPPATQPPSSPPGPSPPTPTKDTPSSPRDPAKASSSNPPPPADADASPSMLRRESATEKKKAEPVEMTPSNQILLRKRDMISGAYLVLEDFGKRLGNRLAAINERVGEGVDLLKEHSEMTPSNLALLREHHEIYEPTFDVTEYGKQLCMEMARHELENAKAELEKINAELEEHLLRLEAL